MLLEIPMADDKKADPHFYALITHLYDERGHRYIYHLCVRSSLLALGVRYTGYANQKVSLPYTPPEWNPCLNWIEKGQRGRQLLHRFFAFSKAFLKKSPKGEKRLFFVESLSLIDVVTLSLAIVFCSKRLDRLWLLFRVDLEQQRLKKALYVFFLKCARARLKTRFVGLSDSALVAEYWGKLLNLNVHLVPIPHTHVHPPQASNEKIALWWPGQNCPTRGLKEIIALIQKQDNEIEIHLSEKAKQAVKTPHSCIFHSAFLSREDYLDLLARCSAVLLPYDPLIYARRTSGIFVEAVMAYKMPFVKEGSWLAQELKKFHLNELIVDWQRPTLLGEIKSTLKNKETLEKFQRMHLAYKSYHTQENYTEALRSIL